MHVMRRGKHLLLGLVTAVLMPMPADADNEADWLALTRNVEERRVALLARIAEAERKGINTDYASVSAHVIATFQTAARHDHDHPEEVLRIFESFGWFKKIDPAETDNLAANELNACLEVADHAMEELRQQIGGAITLSPPPDFSKGTMTLGPGYYQLDGRIVFPSTLTWMPNDEGFLQAFGRMGGGFYQLSQMRRDGSIQPHVLRRNKDSASEQAAANMAPYDMFLGHQAAGWMINKHPEITDGARNFTKYDIDSPLVRRGLEALFEALIPEWSEACGDLPRMHLLANEPHFATQKRGWLAKNRLSDHSMRKYRDWIADKYQSVDALNTAHGTTYTSLDQVDVELPIDPTLRGGPVWFDWCRFNMDRVNDWFTFLKTRTQAHDPHKSPVTIKLLGHILEGHLRDHGMDIEHLTKLQDINGADLRVMPSGATVFGKHEEGLDPNTGWGSRSAYDWVGQSMMLDFTKSLCPDKVFYDSEWHGFGAVSWRHFRMDRDYVRSALWMAFGDGMGAIQAWLWGRGLDGALRPGADHIGELSTQPIALDAYGRTLKELNAHAGRIVSTLPRERSVLILYCEEAAIQNGDYVTNLKAIYEALKLLNVSVGFTTPSEISKLNPETQTLVVPPIRFISDQSLATIDAFQTTNGRIITVDGERNFTKTEMGAHRTDHPIKTIFAAVPIDTVPRMTTALETALTPVTPPMPMELSITDSSNTRAYGVIIAQSIDPESGELSIVMNNVSKNRRVVTLKPVPGQSGRIVDVITRQAAQTRITMDPCDVRLLRCR